MSGSFLVKDNWGKKSSRTILNAYKFHCVFKPEYMHIKLENTISLESQIGYNCLPNVLQISFNHQYKHDELIYTTIKFSFYAKNYNS